MKPYLKGWLLLRLSWGIVEGSVSILRLNSNWESKNSLGQLVAAAKLLQSCLTLSDPMDRSPPGSSIHWILQAKVLEWGAIDYLVISTLDNKRDFYLLNSGHGLLMNASALSFSHFRSSGGFF